jgi:hypothetical protein
VLLGNLDSDATKYNVLDVFKLIFMVGDVRFSEDCCVGDIYIVDMANFGLGHITKITITAIKKLEVCAMVSLYGIQSTRGSLPHWHLIKWLNDRTGCFCAKKRLKLSHSRHVNVWGREYIAPTHS